MTQEQWLQTKEKIDDTFGILEQGQDLIDGGSVEWITFKNPKGMMKLEWRDEPKKIGEHTLSSKRAGANVTIEPVFSDTERIQRLVLLVQNPATGEWDESTDSFPSL